LVRHGFIKDYTVWKFHREAEDSSVGASGGNSSTTMTAAVNAEHQTSSAAARGHDNATTSDNNNADHDYITMDDLLRDTADDNGGGGNDDGAGDEPVRDPKIADLFESIANRLDHDDVLFGSPSWLENFKSVLCEWCRQGIMGHWIAFIVYPQDGKACIFHTLWDTNKAGYKHFESCLR
jgi:hypothetical protein